MRKTFRGTRGDWDWDLFGRFLTDMEVKCCMLTLEEWRDDLATISATWATSCLRYELL